MPAANDKSTVSATARNARSATNDAALRGALRAFATPPNASHHAHTAGPATSRAPRPPPRPTTSSTSIKIPLRTTTSHDIPAVSPQAAAATEQEPKFAWSESLNSALARSTTIATQPAGPPKPSKPPALGDRVERPKVSIHTSGQTGSDGIVKAKSPDIEIHSPKPVRRVTAAASFEAATNNLKSPTFDPVPSPDNIGQGLLEPSVVENSQISAPAPDPTLPALSNASGTVTETGVDPLIPDRPQSVTTNIRPPSATNLERSKKRKITPSAAHGQVDHSAQRIESLANAIVASHLASSRASSPAKSPGPLKPALPRRQSDKAVHSLSLFTKSSSKAESRTPSPAKRMRQTLRKEPLDDDDDDAQPRRPRGHFHLRQHPHKHHEGDRKRWRDEITQRERKRYEGVWAANKDMYMRYTADELRSPAAMELVKGVVSGLVVKDVWARSRLPEQALEEIWELVDRKRLGRLDREEFVVGLWLVDQMLKGRKVPVKVGNSVWQSVRGVHGLKVPKRKQ